MVQGEGTNPQAGKVTVDEFAAKIKEKYPEYKDVDNLKLAQSIVEKYPEYKEVVVFETTEPVKKKDGSTPLPSSVGQSPSQEYEPPTEQDFFKGSFGDILKRFDEIIPLGFGDFIDDMGRAAAQGYFQGVAAENASDLLLRGSSSSDEDIYSFLESSKNQQMLGPSQEMLDYQKIYEENGKGFMGVVLGLAKNPSVVPELVTSSLVAMASDTDAVGTFSATVGTGTSIGAGVGGAAGMGIGALPGAVAGAAASVPYAFAAAGSALEMGATFAELLQEEAGEDKELTPDLVKQILNNEESYKRIRNKAVARGLVIGAIDAYTGKLGGKVASNVLTKGGTQTVKQASRKQVLGSIATATGIEAVGGSAGEAAARAAIGQELDVSEIALEGISEAPGGVRNLVAKRFSPAKYMVNGEKVTAEVMDDLIETMTLPELLDAKISIENDYEGRSQKLEDKKEYLATKQLVKKASPDLSEQQLDEVTELQLELNRLEGNKTQPAKQKASDLRKRINEVVSTEPSEKEDGSDLYSNLLTPDEGTDIYGAFSEEDASSVREIDDSIRDLYQKLGLTDNPEEKEQYKKEILDARNRKSEIEAKYINQDKPSSGQVDTAPENSAKQMEVDLAVQERAKPEYVERKVSQLPVEDTGKLSQELEGEFGLLTAENPMAKPLSESDNAALNQKAEAWLKDKGYSPRKVSGKYGQAENSFFVPGLTKQDAIAFAKEFNQESVAHSEGLIYQDGSMNPRVKDGDNFSFENFDETSDFVSVVNTNEGPKTFQVGYDFATKVEQAPAKPAAVEAAPSPTKPAPKKPATKQNTETVLAKSDVSSRKFGSSFKALTDNFQKLLSKLGGENIPVYVVSDDVYKSVTGKTGRGTFTKVDGKDVILVNADKATLGTVYHEMMHAYVATMNLSPRQIVDFVNTIRAELAKGNASERALAKRLTKFQTEYIKQEVYGKGLKLDDPIIAEEFLSEFVAQLKDGIDVNNMSLSTIDKIRLAVSKFINKILNTKIDTAPIQSRQEAFEFIENFLGALEGRTEITKKPEVKKADKAEEKSREQIDAVNIISADTPKQKAKKEAVAEVLNGFAESQLPPNSSEEDLVSRFLNNIFEESLYTLKKGPRESGMTWYIEDITEFENKMKVLLPELKDPNQMKLFKQVLAITSSGTNPNQNLQTAYTLWVRSNGSAVNFAKNWGEDKISFITKKGVAIGTGIIVSETKTKYVVQKVDALGNPEVFKNGTPKLFEAKKSELKDGYPKPAGFTARGNIVAQQLTKIEKVYEAVGKDINKLIEFFEKPQQVSELRKYNKGVPDVNGNVRKVAVGKRNGAFIFGEKIGAFYQNMIGIGDTITMDLWWSRTWNRYMGTMLSTVDGKKVIQETPRTDRERDIMRKAVTLAAKKLNLDVSELQAVIWYFEQELWTKAGNVSPSFSYVTATEALNNKIKTDEETQKRFSEAGADLTAAEKRRQDAISRANNIIAEGGIQGDVAREQIDWQPNLLGKGKANPAIVNRTTPVQEAAIELLQGKITNAEYQEVVRTTQTIEPITRFFLPASTKDMQGALDSNKAKLLNTPLEDGAAVGLRLDIPAYKNWDIWIVSIHDSGKAGKSLSYGSVAWATDVTFGSNPKVAAFIAAGQNLDLSGRLIAKPKQEDGKTTYDIVDTTSNKVIDNKATIDSAYKFINSRQRQDKTTIARMHGKWKNFEGKTKEDRDASAVKKVEEIVSIENSFPGAGRKGSPWRQVGMNPFRHSFFYDRRTGQPVIAASEVVQIGGLVYAKDVVYADKNDPIFNVEGYKDANGDTVRFQIEDQVNEEANNKQTYDAVENNSQGLFDADVDAAVDADVSEMDSWKERPRTMFERFIDLTRLKIQDKFRKIIAVQEDIEFSKGSAVDLDEDFRNAEALMHGKAKEELNKTERIVAKIANLIKASGLSLEQFNDLLYAMHAQERNRYLRVISTDIGKSLTAMRKKKGMTPSEVAELLGISTQDYIDIEANKIALKTSDLTDVLLIYGTTPSRFFYDNAKVKDGSGMTDVEARKILAKYGLDLTSPDVSQLKPRIAVAVQAVRDLTADTRNRLLESGLETQATIDAFEATYKNYVPLRGFADGDLQSEILEGGRRLEVRGREKRAKGRTTKADSPLTQVIISNTTTIVRAEKNGVMNRFYKLAVNNPNKDVYEVVDPKVTKEYKREIRNGKIITTAKTIADYMADPNMVSVRVGGEYKFIRFKDASLADALRGANVVKADWMVKYLGAFNRALSSFITTYDPEFVLRNFSRDIQTAVLNLFAEQEMSEGLIKNKNIVANVIKDVLPAIKSIAIVEGGKSSKNKEMDQYYREFKEDGARTEWFYSKSSTEVEKDIKNLIEGKKDTALQAAGNLVERINSAVENGVRLSAYVNARKAGISRAKAAELAKNLTVNFNKSGEWGQIGNTLFLFFNASVQGTSRLMRSLKPQYKVDSEGNRSLQLTTAQRMAIGLSLMGSIMSLLNEAVSDDDDDDKSFYSKIPDFEKERNIIIMKPNGKGYWKIPLPYGVNVFYVTGTLLADASQKIKSPGEVAGGIMQAAIGSFSPINFPNSDDTAKFLVKFVTPTIGQVPLALAINENYFGQTIYNKNFPFDTSPKPESELGRKGANRWTKELTRLLNKVSGGSEFRGGKIDINPDKIDFVMESYSGGMGKFVSRSANTIDKIITGNWDQIEPRQVPFLRVFYGQSSKYADLQEFYSRSILVNQMQEEVKARIISGDEAKRVSKVFYLGKNIRKQLSNLKKREDAVMQIKDADVQREKMKKLEELRYKLVADYNKQYERFEIDKLK